MTSPASISASVSPSKAARRAALLASALLLAAAATSADEVVQTQDAFLDEAFRGQVPASQVLWLDDHSQAPLKAIFGHVYPQARLRYWRASGKTAWVLEDIGKEFPITAGLVVNAAQIEAARLLIYRESRGDEIRYPAFLKQFKGAMLKDDLLSKPIDGISGSTLSVAAMTRMARAALALDGLAAESAATDP